MEGWHQGSALTTCRQIARAKFGHHINASEFGQQGRVVELQGVAHCVLACVGVGIKFEGAMTHGLTVCANGLNVMGLLATGFKQRMNYLRIVSCQAIASQCSAMQLVVTRCIQT